MSRSYRITPFGAVVGTRADLVEAAAQILDTLSPSAPVVEPVLAAHRPCIDDLVRVVTMSYSELELVSA